MCLPSTCAARWRRGKKMKLQRSLNIEVVLWEEIERAAHRHGRTISQQIEQLIRLGFEAEKRADK